MKKSTKITTAVVAGIAAVGAVAGTLGTISYFTDSATKTNNFTVGNVEIELYESQLHRMNSGYQGALTAVSWDEHTCDYINYPLAGINYNGLTPDTYDEIRYCTPGMNANEGNTNTISALINGHVGTNRTFGFNDDTIIDDATNNYADYLTDVATDLVPGYWVRKFSYVKNTGDNAAYVLIRYMVPTSIADDVTLKVPSTPFTEDADTTTATIEPYFTAVEYNATTGEYEPAAVYNAGYTQTIDTVEYKVYAAVTTQPINPGEMTFWSPVNTVKINNAVTETTNVNLSPDDTFGIIVDAQAIQAATFTDAVTAINNL